MLRVILASAVVLMGVSAVKAENAATDELPAALQALGVGSDSVVAAEEAHAVRGESGGFAGGHKSGFSQNLDFTVKNGTATGTISLLEGVLGQFSYSQVSENSTFEADGLFGGLSGKINGGSNGLNFRLEGKALQQTLNFNGDFRLDFSQSYRRR